ncbi:MAG: hypothetical protein WCI45_03165 [Desulfuromonadales bacterium]
MMRAKMKVTAVVESKSGETVVGEQLSFSAVCRNDGYPEGGADENNTFAKFTPSADLKMYVNNPDLLGKFSAGQEFYVDFTPA